MVQQATVDLRRTTRIDPLRDLWTAGAIIKNIERHDLEVLSRHDSENAGQTLRDLIVAALDLYLPDAHNPPIQGGGDRFPAPPKGLSQ